MCVLRTLYARINVSCGHGRIIALVRCALQTLYQIFGYQDGNIIKNRCSLPMDHIIALGLHKFSLHDIILIDHHGSAMHSGHYTTIFNCCSKTFYRNDDRITQFDKSSSSSSAYIIVYKLTV